MAEQAEGLGAVIAALEAFRPVSGVFIIAITGSVASGKSTLAEELKAALGAGAGAPRVELVCTDGFLLPNAVLDERGLGPRKGFPESYDTEALQRALADVRTRAVSFPGYSHVIYDIDPALARRVETPDILIVEGLSLHHAWAARPLIDCLIYLEAAEADLQAWFTQRFMGLWAAAEHDPTSFYARFRGMDEARARAFAADVVWARINLPNLRENIVLARDIADLVVRKGPGHEIAGVEARVNA